MPLTACTCCLELMVRARLQLTPPSCLPNHPAPAPLTPVPREPVDWPTLPSNFSISPSPHYAGPFGTMSLGETFSTSVRLANTSSEPVRGVKMMLEMQGPNGRFRLGEIVHDDGQTRDEGVESELEVQGEVEMDVKAEMKDVGVNLLICSVAWETPSGRKTFQRFFKFNVSLNCTPPTTHGDIPAASHVNVSRLTRAFGLGVTTARDQDSRTLALFPVCPAGPCSTIRSSPRSARSKHLDDGAGVRQSRP